MYSRIIKIQERWPPGIVGTKTNDKSVGFLDPSVLFGVMWVRCTSETSYNACVVHFIALSSRVRVHRRMLRYNAPKLLFIVGSSLEERLHTSRPETEFWMLGGKTYAYKLSRRTKSRGFRHYTDKNVKCCYLKKKKKMRFKEYWVKEHVPVGHSETYFPKRATSYLS